MKAEFGNDEFAAMETKKADSFGIGFWVRGGARTHDIQNHNLTL